MDHRATFFPLFNKNFWRTVTKETLVPYEEEELPKDKEQFLESLYEEIILAQYFPAHPREYLVFNKQNFVARIVPVFGYRDTAVYFFAVKTIEHHIAVNRTPGTYGGWRMGNPLRVQENNEFEKMLAAVSEEQEFEDVPSGAANSFDRLAWIRHWKDFQQKAWVHGQREEFNIVVKFDIANFYDSINLNLLEKEIRLLVSQDEQFVVDLLFHFLHSWNRRFEGYYTKSVGLPQDEIGDMSRILANFYLQEADKRLREICDDREAAFLRYSDDYLVYAPSRKVAKEILFEMSKELFKLNLNINSGKTKFWSKEEFETYWAFEIFRLLEDLSDKDSVTQAVEMFRQWTEEKGKDFRDDSVMKRLLSIDYELLPPELRHWLWTRFLSKEYLSNIKLWSLKRLYEGFPEQQREELFNVLDELIEEVRFNTFHYAVLNFYRKVRPGYNESVLWEKIKSLKIA